MSDEYEYVIDGEDGEYASFISEDGYPVSWLDLPGGDRIITIDDQGQWFVIYTVDGQSGQADDDMCGCDVEHEQLGPLPVAWQRRADRVTGR